MAIDEGARHRLYQRLEEVLGPEEAEVLMGHLPPTGWGDVARKRDVDHAIEDIRKEIAELEERIGLRMEATEGRLVAQIERKFKAVYWTMAFTIPVSILGAVEIALRVRGR